jgi:hypothetical protein
VQNLLGSLLILTFLSGSASVDWIQICAAMAVLKSTDNLCKNFPNEVFVYRIPLLQTTTDYLLQITTLAILHNNVDFQVFLVDKAVMILHYVGMLKFAQNVNFCNYLRLFFFVHFAIV